MNAKQLNKIFTRAMYGMVIVAMVFSVTGTVSAQEPAPYIKVSTSNNYLQADGFGSNAIVNFTVYTSEDSSEVVLDITRQADQTGHVFIDGWEHEADLVAGNYVVATDDMGNEKQLVLEPLTIEVFNTSTNYVAGTASPDRYVWVVVGNNDVGYPADMGTTANADGIWKADFDYDFTDDMWGSALVSDGDWDATVYHLGPTPPAFIAVSLTQNWFSANNFMPEKLITFDVYEHQGDEKPVLTFNRIADTTGNAFVDGWEHSWDLKPNNYMVATDGFNTKELLMEHITLDVFDPENDFLSGKAAYFGRSVDIGVGNENGEQWMNVTAGDGGLWEANFLDIFDITDDSWAGAHVGDDDGDVTAAHNSGPSEPPAWFTAFPEQDVVEGWDWPLGAEVHLAIYDEPDTSPVYEQDETVVFAPWGSWQLWVWFDFAGEYDMKAGDLVTLSYEDIVRTHIVQNLSVTKVNQEDDIVKGAADAGAEVHVWPHATGEQQSVIANPKGKWNVSFMGIYDLVPGDGGRAEIRDEFGNATAVDWYIPRPHFTVFPEWEWFDGMDWKDGTTVTITVKNKPECTTTGESWAYFFNGGFPDGCDVVIGDTVKFSDDVTKRTHVVQNLDVTAVDMDENTVSGIADAGTTVYVWPHDAWFEPLQVVADDSGFWQIDLDDVGYDILDDTAGRAEIRDDIGNATAVDWYIPHPRFTVFPLWQWFDGYEWPDGTVNITVSDKPDCSFSKESQNYFFNGGFPSECIVEVGDTVTFDDGNTKREHIVHDIAITAIDLNNDTINGTADADTVYVWAHDGEFEPLQVPVNEFGVWTANLSDVDYNIQEGSSGRAEIRDDMGNATAVDWSLNPRLIVHTEDDWFRAEGFLPNTTLNFWIYDSQGGNQLLASTTAQTDSSGTVIHWVGGTTMNIVPGNQVVVSDGTSTRDVVLEALTFDIFDTTQGILQGTAPEPYGRTVSFGIGCWQWDDFTGDVTTDDSGVWIVDLGSPVPNDFGCVFAWIYDDDGDISEARPEQIVWWEE